MQAGAFKDGSLGILGSAEAYRDGSLGAQQTAYRDGSLGGAYRDGVLGDAAADAAAAQAAAAYRASHRMHAPVRFGSRRPRSMRGLGSTLSAAAIKAALTANRHAAPLAVNRGPRRTPLRSFFSRLGIHGLGDEAAVTVQASPTAVVIGVAAVAGLAYLVFKKK